MKDFKDFTEEILREIRHALPPSFGEGEYTLRRINKLNESYQGLIIRQKDQTITPAINLDLFYQDYLAGQSIQDIRDEIAQMILQIQLPKALSNLTDSITSYEAVKPRLFLRLCNQQSNEALLKEVPYAPVLDLALTFHVNLNKVRGQRASILINREMMDSWGVTEEQLYMDAMNSSTKTMPCEILPIQKALEKSGNHNPLLSDSKMPLYVVRSRGWWSAAAIFYPGVMKKLSRMAQGDYYILPSSINEVLMLPAIELSEREQLKCMVKEINRSMMSEKEILSDHIYYYEREKETLEIIP